MATDERWWQEVVDNDLQAQQQEAREALLWLVEYIGSGAGAARYLRVDPRLVTRSLARIEDRRRLTKRMVEAIRRRLQIIPRQRSDNPVERMAWTVERLDRLEREQRRTNTEVLDRLREVELLARESPVRWHVQMEQMGREVRAQIHEATEMLGAVRDQIHEATGVLGAVRAETARSTAMLDLAAGLAQWTLETEERINQGAADQRGETGSE